MINKYSMIYNEMLSQSGIDVSQIPQSKNDIDLIRRAIVSELDAISLYNQIAETSDNVDVKTVLLDIAKEEKVHVGELQKLLDKLDPENAEARKDGMKETKENI